MFLFGGPFFATENWRLIWLGALMVTVIFFPATMYTEIDNSFGYIRAVNVGICGAFSAHPTDNNCLYWCGQLNLALEYTCSFFKANSNKNNLRLETVCVNVSLTSATSIGISTAICCAHDRHLLPECPVRNSADHRQDFNGNGNNRCQNNQNRIWFTHKDAFFTSTAHAAVQ